MSGLLTSKEIWDNLDIPEGERWHRVSRLQFDTYEAGAKAQLKQVIDNRLNRPELRYELGGLVTDLLLGRLWSGDAIEAILALLPTEED